MGPWEMRLRLGQQGWPPHLSACVVLANRVVCCVIDYYSGLASSSEAVAALVFNNLSLDSRKISPKSKWPRHPLLPHQARCLMTLLGHCIYVRTPLTRTSISTTRTSTWSSKHTRMLCSLIRVVHLHLHRHRHHRHHRHHRQVLLQV